jgi:hypothetical protein
MRHPRVRTAARRMTELYLIVEKTPLASATAGSALRRTLICGSFLGQGKQPIVSPVSISSGSGVARQQVRSDFPLIIAPAWQLGSPPVAGPLVSAAGCRIGPGSPPTEVLVT